MGYDQQTTKQRNIMIHMKGIRINHKFVVNGELMWEDRKAPS